MAAGSGGKSFGVGWLQDQLRARFDIRGPIGEPYDVEPKVQVGMEARPSLPWEWGNARWLPVAGGIEQANGAGFSVVNLSVVAAGTRALVVTSLRAVVQAAATQVGLFVNQAFVAPTQGLALRDGRLLAAGSWLTPVPDAGFASSGALGALPPITDAAALVRAPASTAVDLLSDFLILVPGQTVAIINTTAFQFVGATVTGYLVPLNDIT